MSWKDKLQAATFRGYPFLCESADGELGRRIALHEYPDRDIPYAEDLGRKARRWTLDIFVLGPNYMGRRDHLIEALEWPGSGTLVHPYLGALEVVVLDARGPRESTREGGMAHFTVTFAESGQPLMPRATEDTSQAVEHAADAALAASEEEFVDEYGVDGLPAQAPEHSKTLLQKIADQVEALRTRLPGIPEWAQQLSTDLQDLAASIEELVRAPQTLAMQVIGLVQGIARLPSRIERAFSAYRTLWGALSGEPSIARTTPTRSRMADNQQAIVHLVQRGAVIEAVRVSASMEFASSEDAAAIREELGEQLDRLAETAGDALYAALQVLRTAMVRDIAARGDRLPRLARLTPAATAPALVLGYRIYGDPGRGAEIVARNKIRHPGFVPGGRELEVLTDA